MANYPELLACTAAGLACKSVQLSFFLVFCAACVLDVKTKTFAQGSALTCLFSVVSQLEPKMQYLSLPVGLIAFLLPYVNQPSPKPVRRDPTPSPRESPTLSLQDLL